MTRDHEADCCIGWLNSAFGLMRESGGKTAALQTRLAHSKIVARANGVLPVAECFTARRLRVSVFSRTAIHAPGGWALIENLPNVLTGDRITVGLSSTVTPSLKIKFVSRCTSGPWCLLRRGVAPPTKGRERMVARVVVACQSEISVR